MPGYKRKRGKDSYQLIVTIGTDYKGEPNRYRTTVHCKSDSAAEKELAKFYAACERGEISKSSTLTVGTLCDSFMELHVKKYKRQNTVRGYTCLRGRISPIESRKADNLTRLQVQSFIDDLSKELAPKSVKNTYSFLHAAYDWAIKKDIISKTPCEHIDLPALNKKETPSYTSEQLSELFKVLDALPESKLNYKVAALLALLCGFRRGEICGLDEDDVQGNVVRITKTRNIGKGGIFIDQPKTSNAIRQSTLPEVLKDEIHKLIIFNKKQKLLLGNKYANSPALIKNLLGEPLHPNTLTDWFNNLTAENNLPHVTLHGLRHTHVSMLVNANFDIARISRRVGHGDINITLSTYAHLFTQDDSDIKDTIDAKVRALKASEK